MTDIRERVASIIAKHLGVPAERVVPPASIIEDLGGDSLDHVEIVMTLEETFGIEISDDEMDAIRTVGDAIARVEKATRNG